MLLREGGVSAQPQETCTAFSEAWASQPLTHSPWEPGWGCMEREGGTCMDPCLCVHMVPRRRVLCVLVCPHVCVSVCIHASDSVGKQECTPPVLSPSPAGVQGPKQSH